LFTVQITQSEKDVVIEALEEYITKWEDNNEKYNEVRRARALLNDMKYD
jgi:virulence-associated protein VagC